MLTLFSKQCLWFGEQESFSSRKVLTFKTFKLKASSYRWLLAAG